MQNILKKPTSLQTSIVPKTTCKPSKKLSPMMMTVAPPVVHPSLGLMALMHGVAASENKITTQAELERVSVNIHATFGKCYH